MMDWLSLTMLCLSLPLTAGIKMVGDGVRVQAGVLSTSQHTEVNCDYLKWKQEELYSLTWALQYPGVKTDFLEYKSDGSKRTPSNGIVGVDMTSVDDKRVSILVSETFDEDQLTICCEVKVLHDSGYGSMTPKFKEKCSSFDVMKEPAKPLELDLILSHTEAVVSDLVDIDCGSRDSHSPQPHFTVLVNGREIRGDRRTDKLHARLELTEDHFRAARNRLRSGRRQSSWNSLGSDSVTVECQAMQGGRLMANTSKTITRANRRGRVLDSNNSGLQRKRNNLQASSSSHLLVETPLGRSTGALIVGQVPGHIMESLQNPRTSYGKGLETSEEPVEILNILGHFGFNVVAMANTPDNRIIWTLARKTSSDEL